MANASISIPRVLFGQMLVHCQEELPREACGILSGRAGVVTQAYPMTNVEASPTRYLMDTEEQFRVMRDIWSRGEELAAIYHSHPTTQAYPSDTDIRLAYYPEAVYLIVSLAGATPDVRGFRIQAGSVEAVPIAVPNTAGLWRDLRGSRAP